MGQIIIKKAIEREIGKMYYIDGQGNICEVELSRKGRKKGTKPKRKYQTQEEKEEMMF